MTDFYLLLTPLLVLGVLGLIRFIGCDRVFGLQPVELSTPIIIDVTPGNQRVDLRWSYGVAAAHSFTVMYGTVTGGPYPDEQVVLVTDDSSIFRVAITGLVNGRVSAPVDELTMVVLTTGVLPSWVASARYS